MKNEISVLIKEDNKGEIEVLNAYVDEQKAKNESNKLNNNSLNGDIYYDLTSTLDNKEILLSKPSKVYVVIRLSEDELDVMFSFETKEKANSWGRYWESFERDYNFKTFETNLIY